MSKRWRHRFMSSHKLVPLTFNLVWHSPSGKTPIREYLRGKYHCTIDLLFDWFGLVCFAKKIVSCHTADSKPVKQEVNSTAILPPLVFPAPIFPHITYIFLKWCNDKWNSASFWNTKIRTERAGTYRPLIRSTELMFKIIVIINIFYCFNISAVF